MRQVKTLCIFQKRYVILSAPLTLTFIIEIYAETIFEIACAFGFACAAELSKYHVGINWCR